jgi:membrane protein involved in colicin uptake
MKTLAIRLEEDVHAQLSAIAQLGGTTITDEIRQAIEAHLLAKRNDPELTARADAARHEIEREAQARQQALTDLFGGAKAPATAPSTGRKTARASSETPKG